LVPWNLRGCRPDLATDRRAEMTIRPLDVSPVEEANCEKLQEFSRSARRPGVALPLLMRLAPARGHPVARAVAMTPVVLAVALSLLHPAVARAQVLYPYPVVYDSDTADVRSMVKPRDAAIYVDGYYAGVVDDYDGIFQRLHLPPGQHEFVLYLQG